MSLKNVGKSRFVFILKKTSVNRRGNLNINIYQRKNSRCVYFGNT